MTTLLSIVQGFARRQGLPVPATLIGTNDPQVEQMVELLHETGEDLVERAHWRALISTKTHTTLAAEAQGAITTLTSASFDRIIPGTMWNETLRQEVPPAPDLQTWQQHKTMDVGVAPGWFILSGGQLRLWPVPAAGDTLSFMWQSKAWILDNDGTTQREVVTENTDTSLLPEKLIQAGLRWRWLQIKGLEYAEEFRQYEAMLIDAANRDGPPAIASLNGPMREARPGVVVPPGSWSI